MEKLCQRCGVVWQIDVTRKNPDLCFSCRARKQTRVGDCLIWQGNYAEDMVTPINEDGEPVMSGIAICGHSDCVLPEHRKATND